MAADPHQARKGLLTVRSGSLRKISVGPLRVEPRLLEKSNISAWCRTEFGRQGGLPRIQVNFIDAATSVIHNV